MLDHIVETFRKIAAECVKLSDRYKSRTPQGDWEVLLFRFMESFIEIGLPILTSLIRRKILV